MGKATLSAASSGERRARPGHAPPNPAPPRCLGQRTKVRALRFQRLLAGPFHLKLIRMKCKPKSKGKKRSGCCPHLLPSLLLPQHPALSGPGRAPGHLRFPTCPSSPENGPIVLETNQNSRIFCSLPGGDSLQTPKSHRRTTMDVVVANE